MAGKSKRQSVMDALRELLAKLGQAGPLLKPRDLAPIPVRQPSSTRRRRA